LTRLLPKSNEVELIAAMVVTEDGDEMVSAVEALAVTVPEVPLRGMFTLPGVAAEDALIRTVCRVPGTIESVDGVAVTPAGNGPIWTETLPVKPLRAVAPTVRVREFPPGTTVMADGDAWSEKLGEGGGCAMVNAAGAVCVIAPEVPVSAIFALPDAAAEDAEKLICCSVPGVRASVMGVAVTPAGREPT